MASNDVAVPGSRSCGPEEAPTTAVAPATAAIRRWPQQQLQSEGGPNNSCSQKWPQQQCAGGLCAPRAGHALQY